MKLLSLSLAAAVGWLARDVSWRRKYAPQYVPAPPAGPKARRGR